MASLKQRNGVYLIQFSRRIGDKINQRSFSLGTSDPKKAERIRTELEIKYQDGRIDPFNGWTYQTAQISSSSSSAPFTLEQACERFLNSRSQANDVTKNSYRGCFRRMMEDMGRTMPISQLTSNDLRRLSFRPHLRNATQRSYFTHYRVFFKWLHEEGHISTDLVRGVRPPKSVDRTIDKVINSSDLMTLFTTFENHVRTNIEKGFINHPDTKMEWFKPVIATFFYTGLRSKELIHLRWNDIASDWSFITVRNSDDATTKSGRMRMIPIRKPLIPYLQSWKNATFRTKDGLVYPSVTNRTAFGTPLDANRISRTFKKFVRMAGLPPGATIHGLRHSFGTDLLRKNVPINQVAEIMGHKSIEVTKIYQHLTPSDIHETIRSIDP
jgi:integrase/recombinase XerD